MPLTCILPLTKVVISSSLSKMARVWSKLFSSHSQCFVISFRVEPINKLRNYSETTITTEFIVLRHKKQASLSLFKELFSQCSTVSYAILVKGTSTPTALMLLYHTSGIETTQLNIPSAHHKQSSSI